MRDTDDPRSTEDEAIRRLAGRMALEVDVHIDRAEAAVRNLIRLGLIELDPAEFAPHKPRPKLRPTSTIIRHTRVGNE